MSLRPTSEEVMRTVMWTIRHEILPHVHVESARSATLTVVNLLRHLEARALHEGRELAADNRELRELLHEALASGHPIPHEVRATVEDALATPAASPPTWPSTEAVRDEAILLRAALSALVGGLAATRVIDGASDLEQAIDTYLGRQLEREAMWNLEPFSGERR